MVNINILELSKMENIMVMVSYLIMMVLNFIKVYLKMANTMIMVLCLVLTIVDMKVNLKME